MVTMIIKAVSSLASVDNCVSQLSPLGGEGDSKSEPGFISIFSIIGCENLGICECCGGYQWKMREWMSEWVRTIHALRALSVLMRQKLHVCRSMKWSVYSVWSPGQGECEWVYELLLPHHLDIMSGDVTDRIRTLRMTRHGFRKV